MYIYILYIPTTDNLYTCNVIFFSFSGIHVVNIAFHHVQGLWFKLVNMCHSCQRPLSILKLKINIYNIISLCIRRLVKIHANKYYITTNILMMLSPILLEYIWNKIDINIQYFKLSWKFMHIYTIIYCTLL